MTRARKTPAYVALAGALALIAATTLAPDPTHPWTRHFWCWRCSKDATAIELALNIALFVPMGAALRAIGIRFVGVVATAAAITGGIETLQYFVITGRDASIADCVANLVGGIIGFGLLAPLAGLANPSPRIARRVAIGAVVMWALHAAFAMYAVQPAATRSPLHVQIAPKLEQYDAFAGQTGSAMVNGAVVFDGPAGFPADALVDEPVELSVPIKAAGPTRRYAPILALVDGQANEIAELGQRRSDLVFYTYTRATALGFWSPKIVLPGVLGDTAAMTVSGKRDGYVVSASVGRASGELRETQLNLRPAVSWWLWWPFTIPAAWVITMITWLWLIAAFALIGYWSARGWWAPRLFVSERVVAIVPIIAAGALAHVAVPLSFRASLLGVRSDVAAILLGGMIGLALGALRKSGSEP